jgi:DNA invertase Pin-like site-specific DNA recombinase
MTAPVPADLYLRLSDARNEEALDGREERLRARAAELGWTVYRVVIENDLVPGNGDGTLRPASAWKRRKITTPSGRVELRTIRPGFRSILDDLTAGRARAVLTEDLDRLLRQPRDGEDLLDAVELAGATVRSLSGSVTLTNGGTNDERFVARILANVANKSSADTARRVKDARGRLAGKSYGGGRRPYGYRADPRAEKYHRTLIVLPEEAGVIRSAARDILELGISLKAVARDLRDRRVPTVTGAAWSAETLREVLIKPATAGLAVRAGELAEAPWEPILDRETWEAVRDKLTDPARRTNLARANEPAWLLSGIAVCGECGGRVRVGGGRNRTPAYIGAGCCHIRRKAADLDAYFSDIVVEVLAADTDGTLLRPPPAPEVNAPRLRAERRRLERKRKEQIALHRADVITTAELTDSLGALQADLARIGAQLSVTGSPDPLPEFRPAARGPQNAQQVWDGLGVARRRVVLRGLIASITICRLPSRGRRYPIDEAVKFKFGPGVQVPSRRARARA